VEQLSLAVRPSIRRSLSAGSILPSLPDLSEERKDPNDRTLLMTKSLRRVAERSRGKTPSPFYSIRAVADHFGVAPTTVSRIYSRLKEEGLLASIWGSTTFIQPARVYKQLRMRAVVSLPALLSSFRILPDYRMFFIALQDSLFKCGFAARLVFHDDDEADKPGFAELLIAHRSDFVVWLDPTLKNLSIAARLIDRGVRLITIGDALVSGDGKAYTIKRRTALKKCLACWQRQGIQTVRILHKGAPELRERYGTIETTLCEARLRYSFIDLGSSSSKNELTRLGKTSHSAFVLPSAKFVAQLSPANAASLREMSQHCRVLLCDGPVDPADIYFPPKNVDLISVDWFRAASRIVRDLANPLSYSIKRPTTFEATWIVGVATQRRFDRKTQVKQSMGKFRPNNL
jgi:DNA-binding LacI/PurR family transcriptional regulator